MNFVAHLLIINGLTTKNAQIGNIVSNDKWYFIVNNITVPATISPSKSKNISCRHRSPSSYSFHVINKLTPSASTHTITETQVGTSGDGVYVSRTEWSNGSYTMPNRFYEHLFLI